MRFVTYDPEFVASVRDGGPDANGLPAEPAVSSGAGTPCRCCLRNIDKGEAMLILAARPFPAPQPYAETGPIFLHAQVCAPWCGDGVPPVLTTSPHYLIKGYSADDRIVYGTGEVVLSETLIDEVQNRLRRAEVAYVDVRSARNNCFQTRALSDPAPEP